MNLAFQHLGTCDSMRPVRIKRLELKNVGPFVDAWVEFTEPKERGRGELVLFEGPNGCGKTTILQAIAVLIGTVPGGHERNFGTPLFPGLKMSTASTDRNPTGCPIDSLRERVREPVDSRRHGNVAATIEHSSDDLRVSCNLPGHDVLWSSTKSADNKASQAVASMFEASRSAWLRSVEWAAFMYAPHMATPDRTLRLRGSPDPPPNSYDKPLAYCLNPSADRDVPRKYRRSSFDQMVINLRREYINNLGRAQAYPDKAEHYNAIAKSRKESLDRLETMLSRILERDVRFNFDEDYDYVNILFGGSLIPVKHLGEGMRSTFSWMSDLLIRLVRIDWANKELSPWDQEFWLILDEVEESLHPNRQARILPIIRDMFPRAHVYATTHSPFVVASAGEGTIVPIRPDKDHAVRGEMEPKTLAHGQSLEWVISNLFYQARTGFVDVTRDDLEAHDADIGRIQQKKDIDWSEFFKRRIRLMNLNHEVRAAVVMQELAVYAEVEREFIERARSVETG